MRVGYLRTELKEKEYDGILLTDASSIRWVTGFTGSNAVLYVTATDAVLITDGRYKDQALNEVFCEVFIYTGKKWDSVKDQDIIRSNVIAFQSTHVSVDTVSTLKKTFPSVTWIPEKHVLVEPRSIKTKEEINAIREAQRITDAVFDAICDIEPGMTEQDVAARIVYEHLTRGAEKMSFDPIVASGPNSALPHARPTDRVIQDGDCVVIDMGCFYDGYCSDMTRTVCVGEPSQKYVSVYEAVLEAQEKAIQSVKAGVSVREVDEAAREVLRQEGLEEYFTHSLGHGVGLEIHEHPRVSSNADTVLREGMCITIEPGVYIPGEFGVRIEDIVVVEEDGCMNITRSPKL